MLQILVGFWNRVVFQVTDKAAFVWYFASRQSNLGASGSFAATGDGGPKALGPQLVAHLDILHLYVYSHINTVMMIFTHLNYMRYVYKVYLNHIVYN